MKTRVFLSLMILLLAPAAIIALAADHGSSVWKQMQDGDVAPIAAKIKAVRMSPDQVRVEYAVKEGQKEIEKSANLCETAAGQGSDVSGTVDSDERRAALLQERIRILERASQSKKMVQLSFKGDCIQNIKSTQK